MPHATNNRNRLYFAVSLAFFSLRHATAWNPERENRGSLRGAPGQEHLEILGDRHSDTAYHPEYPRELSRLWNAGGSQNHDASPAESGILRAANPFVSSTTSEANGVAINEGDLRIVGGTKANATEFPYFVQGRGCGASLIWYDIALSAAHCYGGPFNRQPVYIGNIVLNDISKGGISRNVIQQVQHPNYDASTSLNDFLVIKLSSEVPRNGTFIKPIDINSYASSPGINATLTIVGFGVTYSGSGSLSTNLQKATVYSDSQATCSAAYGGIISPTLSLCASAPGKDTCQGDSGGPIIDERGVQVGVTSFGNGCAMPNYPGVYSRISGGYSWIRSQICLLASNPPSYCTNSTGSTMTNNTIGNSTGTNSTISNSTGTNSTISNSTGTNSTISNSTGTNSTISNSTGTNSTINNSTGTNSTISNSTGTNSTNSNSTGTDNTIGNSTDSIGAGSNSTIGNSTGTNSTISNSTGTNSSGSIGAGSNSTGSIGGGSNSTISNSTDSIGAGINSTIGNSTDTNSTISNGTGSNSTGSIGAGSNSTGTNSTGSIGGGSNSNSTGSNSTISNSTDSIGAGSNGTIGNGTGSNSTNSNSTIGNSTINNSTSSNGTGSNSTGGSTNANGAGNTSTTITLHPVVITVNEDRYPKETSWTLTNSTGFVLASQASRSPLLPNAVVQKNLSLPEGTYTFVMRDMYGDGLCCRYGKGNYSIKVDGAVVAQSNGVFTYTTQSSFTIASRSFDASGQSTKYRIDVQYDNSPQDFRWSIFRVSTYTRIAHAPFDGAAPGALVSRYLNLIPGEKYELKLFDTKGDGICCSHGQGSVSVQALISGIDQPPLVYNNGEFGSRAVIPFTAPL